MWGIFFPWIADVWEVWDIFFWDHECLRGVACEFLCVILHLRIFTCNFFTWELWREIIWDRGCLLGVGYFFLRSWMFVRCGVFFLEIVDVWQVWGIFFRDLDHRCLWNYLRSWMFVRCGVFFFGDRRCLTGVGYFFSRSSMFVKLFEIVDVC